MMWCASPEQIQVLAICRNAGGDDYEIFENGRIRSTAEYTRENDISLGVRR
jgi:hypothetical protein